MKLSERVLKHTHTQTHSHNAGADRHVIVSVDGLWKSLDILHHFFVISETPTLKEKHKPVQALTLLRTTWPLHQFDSC